MNDMDWIDLMLAELTTTIPVRGVEQHTTQEDK